ncbi:unnamed protein product, partial [marine sediment metagenome]
MEEMQGLIDQLQIDDLKEKADFVKVLQEKLKIPVEKKAKDFSKEEVTAMILLLKKQVEKEEEKKPPPPPKKKSPYTCSKCGNGIS